MTQGRTSVIYAAVAAILVFIAGTVTLRTNPPDAPIHMAGNAAVMAASE